MSKNFVLNLVCEPDCDEVEMLLTLLNAGRAAYPNCWPPLYGDKYAELGLAKKVDAIEEEWRAYWREYREKQEQADQQNPLPW